MLRHPDLTGKESREGGKPMNRVEGFEVMG
jgi:hypothetical protein